MMMMMMIHKIILWKPRVFFLIFIHCRNVKFISTLYIYHHVVLLAEISLALSRHSSLSSIISRRSSRLHLAPVQISCGKVLVGRPTLAHPCEGVHRKTSLMSSSLLFKQFPSCLVRLIWMALKMGCRWPYSCCFVGCCSQDLFNIARTILVQFQSNYFSICLFNAHLVHPYSKIYITAAWKKLQIILSDMSDFHMIDKLSVAVKAFTRRILMSFSVNETLLPKYVNLSTNLREPPFRVAISLFLLKYMYSVLSALIWRSDYTAGIRLG